MLDHIQFTTPPHPIPAPAGDEIHIWRAELTRWLHLVSKMEPLLSKDERARVAKFRSQPVRTRWILTQNILQTILGSYLQVDPVDVQIDYGPLGKPYLAANPPGLEFNISHTDDLVLCAVSTGISVGIDIEVERSKKESDKYVARYFPDNDKNWYMQIPAAERKRVFLQWWTLEEAYQKARGDGLTTAMKNISIQSVTKSGPVALKDGKDVWYLQKLLFDPHYLSALAAKGPVKAYRFWDWVAPKSRRQ